MSPSGSTSRAHLPFTFRICYADTHTCSTYTDTFTYSTLVFLVSFCPTTRSSSKIIALFVCDLCHSVFRLFCLCTLDSHTDRCVSVRTISSSSTTNTPDKLIMPDSVHIAVLQSNFIAKQRIDFLGKLNDRFPLVCTADEVIFCLVFPRPNGQPQSATIF